MRFRLLMAAGVVLACIGCGPTEQQGNVSGEVLFGGRPLGVGMIAFEPEGGGRPRYVPVQNGKFEATGEAALEPGSYRVRISGSDLPPATGGSDRPASTLEELHERAYADEDYTQILPAAWNTESELTVEVVLGRNVFRFHGDQEEAPVVSRQD